jgi:hypothetical protein
MSHKNMVYYIIENKKEEIHMSNFKFKILNGTNPLAQYNAISVKDPMTFYLLSTGIGYLGTVKLFDATEIEGLVTDMLADDFVADDDTVASTKAIVDFVTTKVEDLAASLNDAFFTNVTSHVITEDDLQNKEMSIPEGVKVGDTGLLFTVDTDNKTGGEKYVFISLMTYLQNVYSVKSTSSIKMTMDENCEIQAHLKIKEGEESMKIDEENGGVYIEKVAEINHKTPSKSKLVTEDAIVKYIYQVINDVLLPTINDNIENAVDGMVTATVDSLNREVTVNGQTYATLNEAVADVAEFGGTITLTVDTATEGIKAASGSNFTIDLNGHALNLQDMFVGSAGTQTNAFQLLKNSDVTFKNGVIKAEDAKIVIQNYSNLTLDNVEVIGSGINQYLVSNNFGNIVFKNGTKIKALDGQIAFDLYYGMSAAYDEGITVTIEDASVIIEGPIEYSKANRANQADFEAKCKLTVPLGYELEIPKGYEWKDNGDGTQTLVAVKSN